MFRKFKPVFACLLGIALILPALTAFAAPVRIGMMTSSVSSEKIAIVLSFPKMEWDGVFELTLAYDPAVLQYSSAGCNRSLLTEEEGNGTVTLKSGDEHTSEKGNDDSVRISVLFNVLDYTPGRATIKCTPKDVYDKGGALAVSGTSLLTVTLRAPASSTESVSSDTGFFETITDIGSDSSVPTDISSDSETKTDTFSSETTTDSDVVSDSVSDLHTEDSDSVQTDVVSDSDTVFLPDSEATDGEQPLPSSAERGAVLFLCGTAVLLTVLGALALFRRRR